MKRARTIALGPKCRAPAPSSYENESAVENLRGRRDYKETTDFMSVVFHFNLHSANPTLRRAERAIRFQGVVVG